MGLRATLPKHIPDCRSVFIKRLKALGIPEWCKHVLKVINEYWKLLMITLFFQGRHWVVHNRTCLQNQRK